jgi:hypothetical protein
VQQVPVGIHGHVALVDDQDYELVSRYHWSLKRDRSGGTYAYRKWWELGEDGIKHCRGQFMHVLITGGLGFDHADRDGLNNQRGNLRAASRQQNGGNSRKKMRAGGCHSQYKGVTRDGNKWRAQIKRPGMRSQYIGNYGTPEEAARAYDAEALAVFGEFAAPNFPGMESLPVGPGVTRG